MKLNDFAIKCIAKLKQKQQKSSQTQNNSATMSHNHTMVILPGNHRHRGLLHQIKSLLHLMNCQLTLNSDS